MVLFVLVCWYITNGLGIPSMVTMADGNAVGVNTASFTPIQTLFKTKASLLVATSHITVSNKVFTDFRLRPGIATPLVVVG